MWTFVRTEPFMVPVVAVSCTILTPLGDYEPIQNVDDSKALGEQAREDIYNLVVSQPEVYKFRVAMRSVSSIDSRNILLATMECFRECILGLVEDEDLLLDETYGIVDGKRSPKLTGSPYTIPCRPFVKGDGQVYTVALASVIAKVTRDRMMREEIHPAHPEYGFDDHKGYGTPRHVEAIHRYGPCKGIHRMSFKALKGR